ncbi:MAG: tryptophan synthase subunit alpha [Candidatus Hydrothermarchaeales archaeon]
MSGIRSKFSELRQKGEGALIGYLTLGDPDIETSKKLIKCLLENVDIMELGVPFSDPIADGPTIQGAIDRALKSGINTDDCFGVVEELRKEGETTPFVFMTYYNIVLQYGEERFMKRCKEVGVDGVLVSDLPIEEADSVLEQCDKFGVDYIFLIAPTTTEERIEKIVSKAEGFLYLVSLLGVTGARERLQQRTIDVTKWALNYTKDLPLAVGFGISKKEHVKAIIDAGAQGAVVGSAFVNIVANKGGDACGDLRRLSEELKEGTKNINRVG